MGEYLVARRPIVVRTLIWVISSYRDMVEHDQQGSAGKARINQTESNKAVPNEDTDAEDTLRRRSVLKMAGGIAAAGVAGVAYGADPVRAARGVSSRNGYETWTIRGQEVYDLSNGETLENVLVDQTAAGACLTIRSRNKRDWKVRNVGFMGVGQAGDGGNRFQFQVSVPRGSRGLIENVWANGKARNGQSGSELGGIYIRSSHAGHIDIKHTYIEGFGNNAVYGSAVGKDSGKDGSVRMENCYHRDNTSTQFRIGSPGSVVRNCVGVVDDPEGKRGPYPGTRSNRNARGIWGKHYRDQRIENSVFYVSADDVQPDGAFEARYINNRSHGDKAVVEAQDCHVNADAPRLTGTTRNAAVNFTNLGESPTVKVIQDGGVPTSPKMAARGEREMPPEIPGAPDDTSDDTSDITSPTDTASDPKTETGNGDTESDADRQVTETRDRDTRVPTERQVTETRDGDARVTTEGPVAETNGKFDFVSLLLDFLGRLLRGY